MALNPTYSVGTVSVSAGDSIVTGTGTLWLAGGIREGDVFERQGLSVTVLSVESNTQLTLVKAWPGVTGSGAYEVRFTPDASRVMSASRQAIEVFGDISPRVDDAVERATAAEAAATPFASYGAALAAAPGLFTRSRRISAQVAGKETTWLRQSGGTCLGGGWSPADKSTPEHWGGVPFILEDQSAAVQAAIDNARFSWNGSSWEFERVVDFGGRVYVCDQPIDCSGLRQPRLTIRNGAILSRAAGKIAFDACLSNSIIFDDFVVYGDAVQSPAWGIYVGRGLLNGTYPGVDGVTFMGRSGCWGHFSRGCLLSFAAEVNRMGDRTFFHNRHRSLTAVAVACVDSMGAVVRHFGSETTSDFQTLPTAATGNHSNICHDWGQTEFRRVADYNLSITSISQAAQAVVGVASGTLAAANIQVGDEVFISGGTMTQIAYGVYEVVAVGTDALTLNVDSTGFSAYTGGASLQNRTGPALLSSGMRTVSMVGAYLLTYGAPCILFDGQGGAPYDWHVQVQFERHSDRPITFKVPSGTIVVPQFHLSATNTSQSPKTAIIWVEGAGVVRFDGGSLRVSNMATAPSQSVMAPQAQIRANGFDIDTPRQDSLPTALLEYSGRTLATDRTPRVIHHQIGLEGVRSIGLATSPTALTGLGLRWAAGGLLAYRPEVSSERKVQIQDSAVTSQLNAVSDRVNTTDKWAGKMVWNVSTGRPVYASGGAASSVWNHSDGTLAHTPV